MQCHSIKCWITLLVIILEFGTFGGEKTTGRSVQILTLTYCQQTPYLLVNFCTFSKDGERDAVSIAYNQTFAAPLSLVYFISWTLSIVCKYLHIMRLQFLLKTKRIENSTSKETWEQPNPMQKNEKKLNKHCFHNEWALSNSRQRSLFIEVVSGYLTRCQ